MATQVLGQTGGNGLFTGNANIVMALPNDMYDLHDLSKAELAAPQLIMLANVALTGEVNGGCCDYMVGEERQMAELTTVGDNNFSDSDGEGLEGAPGIESESNRPENMELGSLEIIVVDPQTVYESSVPETFNSEKDPPSEAPYQPETPEDKCKSLKSKPFRCKPCQYEAESEEEFVHHIRVHSANKFFAEENAEKQAQQAQTKECESSVAEEADFSKGPIRCDRCGYNTNRYDHYLAHLKHHNKAGENERVYKCMLCTYTTVSEYHWKKHLRNHFPKKVYTCSQCSYFSDRKNNYIQHIRTHTGERPYQCAMCPYSSSQKTHLTRHMRTHSGEKPFKCDQCSYVASNQHEVTRHARQVHNGPKPLTCPHCDYKTADRSNFKKHVELHVNPRQFLCPVCDYAASKKCNLQYHIKSRHSDCCDIAMDVSKVKLKKSKKSEADNCGSDSVASEKTEKEQTKTKGDVVEKMNEKNVKVEKKEKENASKEKKPCTVVSLGQVTTRNRKLATESKEVDVKVGKGSEKSCKSKKVKRKMESEAASLNSNLVNDTEPVVKKKKKVESRSRKSQEAGKDEVRVEEHKRQKACLKKNKKKKTLKGKHGKKPKSIQVKPTQNELIPEKPPSPSPPPPVSLPPPPPPPEDSKEKSDSPREEQQKEAVLVEDALVPVNSPITEERPNTQDSHSTPGPASEPALAPAPAPVPIPAPVSVSVPAPTSPGENVDNVEMEDQEMHLEQKEEDKETALQKAVDEEPMSGCAQESLSPSSCEPEEDLPDKEHQTDIVCEMETEPSPTPAEHLADKDLTAEELPSLPELPLPESPLLPEPELPAPSPPAEQCEPASQTVPVSSSAPTAANESQEIDEDEGIHSHDGSDLSDNMSEGSDDSGLNGARSVQEETGRKASQEEVAAAVEAANFVCIFCDRSFRKEGEYSKHLNRHLVNVYYLEEATKELE
ncbi:RE1-silencing transcription factor [Phascolarctos cinereus]|uniref:RE1-silencing transcription factor n=1 Tax=Phascolarctos cinereus TaxID=38626 RepID=A0A6P5JIQ3_PHACI|nr:RE1-silencing transcription factor [Phascolarctos cinereus]XP_020830966.1 RE1-silencing transcription factor [Phascolarctos cinereus]XP_020830967.1 RE1-silencing transcription factor [Phascolarctos cinereus]XP_020830968.1 RE1-silencing transcription factor [Phascolarctos cinereus]